MPSDRRAKCFSDIIAAIDLIDAWIKEAGGAQYTVLSTPLVRSAIERQLLIISEAAIRLDKLDATAAPHLAPSVDWPGIRGMGNFIRHRYDDLDAAIIANVVSTRLAELRSACATALEALSGSPDSGLDPEEEN